MALRLSLFETSVFLTLDLVPFKMTICRSAIWHISELPTPNASSHRGGLAVVHEPGHTKDHHKYVTNCLPA